MKRGLAAAMLACACSAACAQDFHVQGFLEARLPAADSADRSWTDGGLGKMRFGDGDSSLQPAGALSLSWQISESLLAVADLQAQGQTSPELGLLCLPALAPGLDLAVALERARGRLLPAGVPGERWRRLDQPLDADAFRAQQLGR